MKAKLLGFCLLTFLCTFISNAQVGIGNTNPQATLDIEASSTVSPANNDGILIPRMSAFPSSPGATRDGMLIFYTGTGAEGKGFYYWDQGIMNWVVLKGTNDNDWHEVGTSSPPNDINDNIFTQGDVAIGLSSSNARLHVDGGTTPFRIDRSGNEKLSFRNNALEFHNNGSSIFIGEDAGLNDDLSLKQNIAIGYSALRSNVDQNQNIAIGNNALRVNTGGDDNIAIGDDAMSSSVGGRANVSLGVQTLFTNVSGNNNVAIGSTSLRSNISSHNNVALGHRTLYNTTTGGASVALGFDAGYTNSTGQNNIFLGANSGYLNTGSNNVFLGYNSGYNETGSNKLYISNSNTSLPLIYGEFDNNVLRTNGELQVGDPTGTGYALPTADGTANQVLTTDGSGQANWQDNTSSFTLKDPKYPDGFENLEPITLNNIRGSINQYTVPTGKNLYISNIYSTSSSNILLINNTFPVSRGIENTGSFQSLTSPIILGSGDTLHYNGPSGSDLFINGFLVDAYIEPITFSGNYTVAAGKNLIILNANTTNLSLQQIRISSIIVYRDTGIYKTTAGLTSFMNPIFANEGELVYTTLILNGYLIDK